MGFCVVVEMLHGLFGLARPTFDGFIEKGLYTTAECLAVGVCAARAFANRQARAPWILVTLGLATWTAGDAVWTFWLDGLTSPPFPSVADALYLSWYPAIYVALGLLMRAHYRHAGAAVWLDGLVVGATTAAIGAALILPAVLGASRGNAAEDAVNIAYPLGDLLLLIFIALGFALSGWRPGRQWVLLGLGIAVSACADMTYLYESAHGTYAAGHFLDSLWPASMLVLALAAWQPAPTPARVSVADRPHTVVLPAISGMVALALLVDGTIHPLARVAVALATIALLGASARAALTYLENTRILRDQSRHAVTDTLTGLGNRRKLNGDLEEAAAASRAGRRTTLAFFDLNGFKHYNDTFGHNAGDALLARLGGALADSVAGAGQAYRLGGDEFCVMLDGIVGQNEPALAKANQALVDRGSGFTVDAASGVVAIPDEASTASDALGLADKRMYSAKGHRQRTGHAQIQGVLMRLLGEREPLLHSHLRDVGALAVAVGRHFALDSERLDELCRAAELHDIGMLAIPDDIVHRAGPLNEEETRFIQQHTLIGQRVLDVAPALSAVAQLVRSTHERWDGTGYPDGLADDAIPLGSRIIAVCDAYTAMTTDRPHELTRTPRQALHELQRHAGKQFDPAVVDALCRVLTLTANAESKQAEPTGDTSATRASR